jgi:hypothetical protein
VERSHLTDDHDFYLLCLLKILGKRGWLKWLQAWQYVYNVRRNHFGHDKNRKTPLEKSMEIGYTVDERFAMFPVVLLDNISSHFITTPGNDFLTKDSIDNKDNKLCALERQDFAFWIFSSELQ